MSTGTYSLHNTDAGAPTYGTGIGGLIPVFDGFLVSILGWTKTVWATNQVSYQAPGGGASNQRILSLDDTNTAYTIVSGWETLTAWNTGTGQFPLSSINSLYIARQTTSADIGWRFFGTQALFHFFYRYDAATYYDMFTFGDFYSYKATDQYNTIILGRITNSATTTAIHLSLANTNPIYTNASTGCYIDRSYQQLSLPVQGSLVYNVSQNANSAALFFGQTGGTYPDPVTGYLNISPIWIGEPTQPTIRGLLPGIWNILHTHPLSDLDTFSSNVGVSSGRTFEVAAFTLSGTAGQFAFETSNTWGGI